MKRVLITGANSFIGESIRDYLEKEPYRYMVCSRDAINWIPTPDDFVDVDVVVDVVGIAHIKETKANRQLYYDINRDLNVKIAKAAKQGGVKQFILFSSMSVYGLTTGHISKTTPVKPVNAYGRAKAEADEEIQKLEDEEFIFTCLRPPMIYGKGCKGNYQRLRKLALKVPIFPKINNKRSMLYIGNLCEFVKQCIDDNREGLFFPQNAEWVNTSDMVKRIAECHGKKILFTRTFNWIINVLPLDIMRKVFGSLIYEQVDLIDKYDFGESVNLSER